MKEWRVPVRTGRLAALGTKASSAHSRRPQPRYVSRCPRKTTSDEVPDGLRPEDDHGFGAPGPRMSSQHPLYVGFMGTAGVGIALAVFYIASNTTQLILWIVAALFIALGLDPVVRWLESRKVPRPAGILISVSALVLAVAGFFATLIPTIVEQVSEIVRQAPEWIRGFLDSDFFRNADSQFGVRDRITTELDKFVKDPEAMGGIFGGVVGFGSTVANGLFGSLIVLVLSLYFLAALPSMKKWAYRLAPRSRRPRVEALSEAITDSVGNYVIGQACVALLNAIFAFIVMTILGIPFSVLLAFVVALLAFIPLVGGMIAAVVVILVALTAGWQTAVDLRDRLLRLPAVRGLLHLAAHHATRRGGSGSRGCDLGDRRRQPARRPGRADRHSHRGRHHAADQGSLHRPPRPALTASLARFSYR